MENKENKPSEGENLERVRLNELVNSDCPQCGKSPVLIFERVLIEGSLENFPIAIGMMHTEVEDFYECPSSKHSWKKFQYL